MRATGPSALTSLRKHCATLVGGTMTVAMALGIGHQLLGSGLTDFDRILPGGWAFYLVFILLYVAQPLGDFIIFRRLWTIPAEGLAALFKKRIANDVLVGFSGDAYFYAWAKQRARMASAPFGAVKDVMILSAIAGNAVTLVLVAVAFLAAVKLLDPRQLQGVYVSVLIVLGLTVPYFLLSRRVFSLRRETLWWTFNIQMARQVACALLLALAWHLALPGVSLGSWLVLAAARMMVTRLPFVPNKDLLFANFAILLIGGASEMTAVLSCIAALTLTVHVALMVGFSARALIGHHRVATAWVNSNIFRRPSSAIAPGRLSLSDYEGTGVPPFRPAHIVERRFP